MVFTRDLMLLTVQNVKNFFLLIEDVSPLRTAIRLLIMEEAFLVTMAVAVALRATVQPLILKLLDGHAIRTCADIRVARFQIEVFVDNRAPACRMLVQQ